MEYIQLIVEPMLFAVAPFLSALLLAFIFKVFVKEEFPTWMGVLVGLAFVGFGDGLSEIAYSPSVTVALKFIFAMLLAAWGSKLGNRFAAKFTSQTARENGYHLLKRSLYKVRGKDFIEITMPSASEIQNIYGKKPISNDLKREIGGKKFVEPADLPVEILEARIKRRFISDWRVGDAEVKLDETGHMVKLALSAKKTRISSKVPEGMVLFSFKPESVPFELCFGDRIDIFIGSLSVRGVEVLNVEDQTILAVMKVEDAEKLARKISTGSQPSVIAFPGGKEEKKQEEKKQEKV